MKWFKQEEDVPPPLVHCLVCGYATLSHRGVFEICPVCFWEDDGESGPAGGPNGSLDLTDGRNNFAKMGATEERLLPYVRPPEDDELVKGLPLAAEIKARQTAARNKHGYKKESPS